MRQVLRRQLGALTKRVLHGTRALLINGLKWECDCDCECACECVCRQIYLGGVLKSKFMFAASADVVTALAKPRHRHRHRPSHKAIPVKPCATAWRIN